MRIDDAIEDLNPNEINITKVLSLPSWLEIEDQYSFLHEERAQPPQCVTRKLESKSLSEVLIILASTNLYFKPKLLFNQQFQKQH